jgi:6-phosphofructokinase
MKIAVLTSGGDSAGMNAAVRAIVKAGILKYAPSVTASSAHCVIYTSHAPLQHVV